MPRLPEIRDQADMSTAALGVALAVAGIGGLIASAMVGHVVSAFGTRRTIIGGGALLVGSLPVIGLAGHPLVLVAGLSGIMVGDLFADVAMNLQASAISGRRRTPVMNRLHGLWSVGTVTAGTLAALISAAGVPVHIHLALTAMLLILVLLISTRGLLTTDEPATHTGAVPRSPATTSGGPGLIVIAILGLCAYTAEILPGDWAALRLVDDLGTSVGFAGLGYVAFTLGVAAGRLTGDWLQAVLGPHRLLRSGAVVAIAGISLAGLTDSPTVALVCYAVTGVGIAPLFPRLYDDAARRPGRPGAGLGALTAGTRIASLAAPAAVVALASTSLSLGAATALLTVSALIVVVFLRQPVRPSIAAAATRRA